MLASNYSDNLHNSKINNNINSNNEQIKRQETVASSLDYLYQAITLIEQNKILKFPHFFREEIKDDKDLYMEACKLYILELFHIYPDTNINKINMFFNETMLFKGYFHKTENNTDELLMVFEYKEDKQNFKSIIWATLHEINNTKKVMDISIPTTYSWFLTFPELLYLTDKIDKIIDIPYSFILIAVNHRNNLTIQLRTDNSGVLRFSDKTDKQGQYANFYDTWDLETQMFISDLKKYLEKN
jgi:hypothetical protein